jgi:hypothetical protein
MATLCCCSLHVHLQHLRLLQEQQLLQLLLGSQWQSNWGGAKHPKAESCRGRCLCWPLKWSLQASWA